MNCPSLVLGDPRSSSGRPAGGGGGGGVSASGHADIIEGLRIRVV